MTPSEHRSHGAPILSRISRTTSRRIAEDGYTILPDAIEPDLVDEIDDALLKLEHDLGTVPAENLFEGVHTMRIYNLLVHGTTFEQIPVHPNVLPVVEGVLDPGCLISSLSSIAIGPDETAQPIHADDQLIPLPEAARRRSSATRCGRSPTSPRRTAPPASCPGTHLRDHSPEPARALRHRSPPRCPRAACSSGTAASGTAAAPTRTDERRVGIAMNYCAGYIRQQENQQLGIPPSTGRDASRRACRSWSATASTTGSIGHIDKQHPAKVVLDRERGRRHGVGPAQEVLHCALIGRCHAADDKATGATGHR